MFDIISKHYFWQSLTDYYYHFVQVPIINMQFSCSFFLKFKLTLLWTGKSQMIVNNVKMVRCNCKCQNCSCHCSKHQMTQKAEGLTKFGWSHFYVMIKNWWWLILLSSSIKDVMNWVACDLLADLDVVAVRYGLVMDWLQGTFHCHARCCQGHFKLI